jgi:ppGpp synthetase/RelA/SpoT-type nucleotidyltranferase
MTTLLSDHSSINELLANAQEALQRLEHAFALNNEAGVDFVFYTKSRVKTAQSMLQKIRHRRLKYGKPYNLTELTDVVGYRVVTLYDDQLESAIKWTLDVLSSAATAARPLIDGFDAAHTLTELKAFPRPDPETDIYVPAIKRIKQCYNLSDDVCQIAPKNETHYSSMHLLLQLNSYANGKKMRVATEIQFRTAIEDIWAEISHRNQYKILSPDIWSPQLDQLHATVTRRVALLKKQFDHGLPDQINEIRSASTDVLKCSKDLVNPSKVETKSFIFDQLGALLYSELSKTIRASFDSYEGRLCDLRASIRDRDLDGIDAAVGAMNKVLTTLRNWAKRDHMLLETVEAMIDFERIRLDIVRERVRQRISLEAENSDEVASSEKATKELYAKLDSLRHGGRSRLRSETLFQFWLYFSAKHAGLGLQSRRHLEASYKALSRDQAVPSESVLRQIVPRFLAREMWDQAESESRAFSELEDKDGSAWRHAIDCYRRAFEFSLEAFGLQTSREDLIFCASQRERWLNLNNVVTYAADCLRRDVPRNYFDSVGYSLDQFRSDVDELAGFRSGEWQWSEQDRVATRHTLMISYFCLGVCGKAKSLAEELKKVRLSSVGEFEAVDRRLESDVEMVLRVCGGAQSQKKSNRRSGGQQKKRRR